MKTNTFKTFIEENYYDSICTRLNGFISTHPSFIREKINASVNVHHPELEDFTIEAVYIDANTRIRDFKRDLQLGSLFYR